MLSRLYNLRHFRSPIARTARFCSTVQDLHSIKEHHIDSQALQQALRYPVQNSLRTVPIFQHGYGQDEWRLRKKKRKYNGGDRQEEEVEVEEEEGEGEGEEEVMKSDEVPTVIFRKKKRMTGSAPKLYRHLYPGTDYVYFGKIDLSHLPEEMRRIIPIIENTMERRCVRSPATVSQLWRFLEQDPKEAFRRANRILTMLPQGVSFETFFKRFPALLFDDNMRYLEMGEACVSLMDQMHHFRLGYKYGIYDMDHLLEVYRKGRRLFEAWESLHFDHGWSKKQFLEGLELTTVTIPKFPQIVVDLQHGQVIEILLNPQKVEKRIKRFAQVYRNYNWKNHFFVYYLYLVRADSDKFSKFLDIFLALNPIRAHVGGVTSHQIEAVFETYKAMNDKDRPVSSTGLKASSQDDAPEVSELPDGIDQAEDSDFDSKLPDESKISWSSFIEDFKLMLADKDKREFLRGEFQRSRSSGKRKRLRKRILECMRDEPVDMEPIPKILQEAKKLGKKSLADLFIL